MHFKNPSPPFRHFFHSPLHNTFQLLKLYLLLGIWLGYVETPRIYVRKTADDLVLKRGKNLVVTPENVAYEVSYKPFNGIYYINHIRGDLNFKVQKKNRLFSSNLHVWFELVNCKTDTKDVRRFSGSDKLPTKDIFSETSFVYDKDFWEHFNVILPEDKLRDLVQKYDFGNN